MNDGESMSHNIQVLNTNALLWGTSSSADFQPFPEWTKFLVELGGWIGGLPDTSGRLFCTVLLPSRILASSLVAFGALSRSLKDPSNAILWETFLDYEAGTKVYFLYNIPKKGKRQFEGALGDVTSYKNEYLREIHIDGRRREHKNLTMSLSKSLFEEASVSLQAHYRTTLLNSLNNLSISFQK